LAKTNRLSKLTYRASERVLENIPKDYDQDFHLSKKQYYNLIPSNTRSKEEIITGLLQCLDNSMSIVRIRYSYTLNDAGAPVQKNIEQIFLLNNYQRGLSKRFISDFMMETDATVNTNALKMLLLLAVGVTNTAMTFSACFSFAIPESEEAFNFFIQCMHEELFNDCLSSRIIIASQDKGLTASLPISMPEIQLQLCNWHACENIRALLSCKSTALLTLLHPPDREYF